MVNQYPYSNFHELNLDWVLETVKNLANQWTEVSNEWTSMKDFINNYFNNLDLTQEVSDKIDELITNGTIPALLEKYVKDNVSPTPKYAANVAGMTDRNSIYLNGSDGKLYAYTNNAWTNTGIVYGGEISSNFTWGFLIRGSVTCNYTATTNSGSLVFSETARLALKNGAVSSAIAGTTLNYSIPNTNMYYVCFNSLNNELQAIPHNSNNLMSNDVTPLFGIYGNVIIKGDMEMTTTTSLFPQPTFQYVHILEQPPLFQVTDTTCKITFNYFVGYDRYGNIIRKSGQISLTINPTIAQYIVYNNQTEDWEIVDYNRVYQLAEKYDIIAIQYHGNVISPFDMFQTNTMIVSPAVFVRLSGTKVKVSCSTSARAVIKGITYNISSWTLNANVSSVTTLTYIVMTETGFVTAGNNYNFNTGEVIAVVYNHLVHTNSPYVVTNMIPITQWTQRPGTYSTINFDRFGANLAMGAVAAGNTNFKFYGDWIDFRNSIPPLMLDIQENMWTYSLAYNTNNVNVNGKNVLMIGDSITNRGWLQEVMADKLGVTFSGTNPCQYADYMCEGYPGQTSSWMIDSSSPFYNPNTSAFDFHYYCTLHNIEPDYVTIEFGLNESIYGNEFRANIQTMISSIKAHNSNIIVYVLTPFRRYKGAHTQLYYSNDTRFVCNISNICACEELTDCVLIPTHAILNDAYDYVYTDIPYGYGELTVSGCADPIHPSKEVGFLKLGTEICNWLGWE